MDLRYSLRALRKSPGFATVAILTLALGIGANTAIFSVVDSVLLKPLPYPHSERLVFIKESLPKAPSLNVAWPDFLDWRAQNQVFTGMAAFQPNRLQFNGPADSKLIPVGWVTPSFFRLLGAKMQLGRALVEADEAPGDETPAVLSYGFWQKELRGDPAIAGKAIAMANGSVTVAGVLAPDFRFEPWDFDVLLPIGPRAGESSYTSRANHPGLAVMASLRPGVSLERARADMNTIMDRLGRAYPESNRNESAVVNLLSDQLVGPVRSLLLMLFGAVGFVLLMACANVANLALARAAGRQREFAVRAALGAGRGRLIRQLLGESLLLSVLGGAAGVLLAMWSLPALVRLYPANLAGLRAAGLDPRVLLFTLAACLLAAVLFGLAPILQATRTDLNLALRDGSRSSAGRSGGRLRAALFVAEVAIALVLAVGAGLLLRSMAAVLDVNPGFQPDRLLSASLIRNIRAEPQQHYAFFADAVERIARQPGVESAGAAMCAPLGGTCWTSPYWADGQTPPAATERPWTALNMITPGFFQTMKTPLLEGRFFSERDRAQAPRVAILNQTFARRLWPGERAAGKRIHVQYADGELLEVVGVVADIKQFGLEAPNMPEVYVPAAQMPVSFMTVMARTSGDAAAGARAVTAAIHDADPGQAISRVTPVTESIATSLARRRFGTFLLSLFGGLALALAAVGVFGVMACTVAQRTHEIGIRVALGARRAQVLRMVLGQALRLAGAGVALGLGAAWALVRFLQTMLFAVKPYDPLTFGGMAVLLAAVALGACALPARRATKVDPMVTLRAE
jgi:putative ABC transport system permease protein